MAVWPRGANELGVVAGEEGWRRQLRGAERGKKKKAQVSTEISPHSSNGFSENRDGAGSTERKRTSSGGL